MQKHLTVSVVIFLIVLLELYFLFARPKTVIHDAKPEFLQGAYKSVEISENLIGEEIIPGHSQAQQEQLSLILLGTLIGNIKDPLAFIKDLETGNQKAYRSGDAVRDLKLIKIAAQEVTLQRNGENTILRMRAEKTGDNRIAEDDSGFFTALSSNRILVNKKKLLKEPQEIIESARKITFRPYFEADKVGGFKIAGVTDNSLAARAGMQNNDVIQTVNNQKVDSYQKALQLFNKAKGQTEVKVSVLRNGQIIHLQYQIN